MKFNLFSSKSKSDAQPATAPAQKKTVKQAPKETPVPKRDAPSAPIHKHEPKLAPKSNKASTDPLKLDYPRARRDETVVDNYHGVEVKDPYRWLEDPDSEETKEWVNQQNALTKQVLDTVKNRDDLREKMAQAYNYEKYGKPIKVNNRFYFTMNNGLQNQAIMYYTEDYNPKSFDVKKLEKEGKLHVFLDPNTLREDGTGSLNDAFGFSPDGKYFAYSVSLSGSDWATFYVRDVESGKDLSDVVEWVKFSDITWTPDSKGFFYCGFAKPEALGDDEQKKSAGTETDISAGQRVCYHALFTDSWEDPILFELKERPKEMFDTQVSRDGKTVFVAVREGTDRRNSLWYGDMSAGSTLHARMHDKEAAKAECTNAGFVELVPSMDAAWEIVTNFGCNYVFQTNHSAPKSKLVAVRLPLDKANPTREELDACIENHLVLVPEAEHVLEFAKTVGSGAGDAALVLLYLENVASVLKRCSLPAAVLNDEPLTGECKVDTIALPDGAVGAIPMVQTFGNGKDAEWFFHFVSFSDPGSIFRCLNNSDGSVSVSVLLRPVVAGINLGDFVTVQEMYESKDGTKIPMFKITMKAKKSSWRKSKAATTKPTILWGYGGFNIPIPPMFNVFWLLFVKHYDGVFCVANIRGGGEFGEEWHKAGTVHQKQNVFDDFIAAGEHLVKTGVTTPRQLAIHGRSNGGLLIGACITQRPNLFGCGVATVGVLDMLRFHKFTIGHAWCGDYGNAEEFEDHFRSMYKYSPIHQAARMKGTGVSLPSLLITTADHDDRVVPLHSFKFTATVQDSFAFMPEQTKPLIARIEVDAGHGAGKPTKKVIEEYLDILSFIALSVGATYRA